MASLAVERSIEEHLEIRELLQQDLQLSLALSKKLEELTSFYSLASGTLVQIYKEDFNDRQRYCFDYLGVYGGNEAAAAQELGVTVNTMQKYCRGMWKIIIPQRFAIEVELARSVSAPLGRLKRLPHLMRHLYLQAFPQEDVE